MITKYEIFISEPKIGDWVLVRIDDRRRYTLPEWTTRCESTPGKVSDIPQDDGFDYSYKNDKNYFRSFKLMYDWNNNNPTVIDSREILFFSDNKDDVLAYIQSKKYNL